MVIPFFQPLLWFLFWGRSACVMQDKLWPLSLPIAKERNIYNIFFLMAVYNQIGCLCIYWAACLQTMWLSGCQHHHSLPRIDPPTARLLSALSCRIDVLSNDFHTYLCFWVHACTGILKTVHTQHSALTSSYSIQRLLQEPRSATRSVTLLIFPLLGGIALPRSN